MAAALQADDHCPIVAVGVAADGLAAVGPLLAGLSHPTGIIFLLALDDDGADADEAVAAIAADAPMPVVRAAAGTDILPDQVHVAGPESCFRIVDGGVRVAAAPAGAEPQRPFDRLLRELGGSVHAPVAVVLLSGLMPAGDDALAAIKATGALVLARDPQEAPSGGAEPATIDLAKVDAVLPAASIAPVLNAFARTARRSEATAALGAIIDLVSTRSSYDFHLYKPGTLQRRIEQRMLLSKIPLDDSAAYLSLLQADEAECARLAEDMLINVTQFFRDLKVFDLLETSVIPGMVGAHDVERPLRVWVVGCSTGEEVYSLAILFLEAIAEAQRPIKLQIFASDVCAAAIATARKGAYPLSIQNEIPAARLRQYFLPDALGYRASAELRNVIVFTVHDVLNDPPFPRIDLISCRNMLIYLTPPAQAKVIDMFHFALRKGGILVLGSAETVPDANAGFDVVAKSERIFRQTGHGHPKPPRLNFEGNGIRSNLARTLLAPPRSREAAFAEIARRTVLNSHAPAAVLIDRARNCLYFLGPTAKYLHVATGYPTNDLLDMAAPALRAKLRSAIEQVVQGTPRVVIGNARAGNTTLSIDVQAVTSAGEDLLLVAFVEDPTPRQPPTVKSRAAVGARAGDLERELAETREELHVALEALETAKALQKEINEDALSVTEEYQSTNEELLTSKEELQSLNEELTALNGQLHEALERERSTSDDLQNVLYSTDVATLCLDTDLRIRFFTPNVQHLFTILESDVGRPIADIRSLSNDDRLGADALSVMSGSPPRESTLEVADGRWFYRRVLPYHTHKREIEGVVITFADITERKHARETLVAAKHEAELASVAKSRFLAAASHDLRQPLQSLILLQAMLAQSVHGEQAENLVDRIGRTLDAMTGMLNVLLDINQIEAGVVQTDVMNFPIESIFQRLRDEFIPQARDQRLDLRIPPCGLSVHSDPRLLEQMIRNLLANAMKYTREGGILLGCRRDRGEIRLELWDTGIGIAEHDLDAIFDEFHQVDNSAREISKGMGLGLSIVQRLGALLRHDIGVRSRLGKGSVFSIKIPLARPDLHDADMPAPAHDAAGRPRHSKIIVIEDDPEVRNLLELLLAGEGHLVRKAETGDDALALVANGAIRPDLVLADYNLPGTLDGLAVLGEIRSALKQWVPGIILTGGISKDTQTMIAEQDCLHLSKPVKPGELMAAIKGLIGDESTRPPAPGAADAVVHVIDGQAQVRASIRDVLNADGFLVACYPDAESFLAAYRAEGEGCVLTNTVLPGMSGMDLLVRLQDMDDPLPTIMMAASSDVNLAVAAMKAGACDFIEKPVSRETLRATIGRALAQSPGVDHASRDAGGRLVADLSPRQVQVMERVLAGQTNEAIAAELGISRRTVESHRAAIMRTLNARSLPDVELAAV